MVLGSSQWGREWASGVGGSVPVLTEINSCSWALGMKDKLGYTTIVLSISFQLNFKDVHFASAESPWFIHIIGIIMCTVPTHDHVHMNNVPITAARLLRI